MGIFLCSALALAAAMQVPQGPVPPSGSDSGSGPGWLLLGRTYLRQAEDAHRAGHRASLDTVWARTVLDTAEQALITAARLLDAAGPSAAADSARVLRVGTWSLRARLALEEQGIGTGPQVWGPLPLDLKIPPVLEELGESLLRACPMWGVLLTADEADTYAAWYMRFARGLRPDLLIVPLAAWRGDSVLRVRLGADLHIGHRAQDDAWLPELARRRPVCVSMAFERPPEPRPRVRWKPRAVLWVTGPEGKVDGVSPGDFGFAALRVALDRHDPWAAPALAVYARAARTTRALCQAMAPFKVAREVATCRR